MTFVNDDMLSPKPDTHGTPSHPINSTDLVLPYGDQHDDGMGFVYPIDSSGDVHPKADDHSNKNFQMHEGTPKPGSFR
jgi:hypothetical protein